jgi:hypothetical protein
MQNHSDHSPGNDSLPSAPFVGPHKNQMSTQVMVRRRATNKDRREVRKKEGQSQLAR